MRTTFYEYYGLSEKEVDRLWKTGLIVFDTNVLLSLYRLSHESQEEILSVMRGYKERLWLPHQVGYEYHENRLENATRPIELLKGLEKKVLDFEKSIKDAYSSNPYVEYKKLETSLTSLKMRFSKLAKEWLESCPQPIKNDDILTSLTGLFDGKIGKEYDSTRLSEIYTIGKERYDSKIPPGYKDAGKETGDRHIYGDLIIWLQIIEKAKEANKDVIFVTDDCKEDWWASYKDDKLGPRRELIREFRKEAGNHIIWFYTTERFLTYAKTELGASVKTKTIVEVKKPAVDWTNVLGLGSEVGEMSLATLAGQRLYATDESDPNGIGRTSRLFTRVSDNLMKTNPLLADSIALGRYSSVLPSLEFEGASGVISPDTPSLFRSALDSTITFPTKSNLEVKDDSSKTENADNKKR